MNQSTQDRVIIFDTTLRDGEQAPGCSMTLREKLRVATALRDLRVDVIDWIVTGDTLQGRDHPGEQTGVIDH